ncbi:MAG: autotransporter-associated beta strand repeat-containing protein, partial [Prosthecobacter sp.]
MKAPLPPKVSPNAIKCDRFSLYGWWLMITLTASVHLHAQTITWNNNGASTAWYTAASWNPSTASGAWTTSNVAQFQNTGSATTAGINMNTSALSIGAIEVSSARTRVLTIGNSSGTTGNLTLNGATLNSVNNVVLRNASSFALTLQNNETGSGKTMGVVLANSTDNRILLDGSGNIAISSVISGTGRPLSVSGSGSGQLVLSTGNTYTGKTTLLTGGTVSASGESAFGANPGAFVADQIIFNGGALSASGNINFSSNRGITLQAGGGTFNSNGNTITLTNIVTGAGSMTKTGAGTLSLPSAHTHSGDTILTANAGILSLGSVNALQNTTLDTGATGTQSVTFDVAGTNTYNVGGLKGTDALDIGGNTLSVGANNQSAV